MNGISVNGLGEASMDLGQSMMNANLMGLSNATGTPPPPSVSLNQPNIHPGCIPSTGRINSGAAATGGANNNSNNVFSGAMPVAQNLSFSANGGNQGFIVQQQQQAMNYGANNMTNGGGGGGSGSGGMKFNSQQHGSLQQQQGIVNHGHMQQQQTYMHHN